MTRTEHLLAILLEESHEVGQRATNALRFGLAEVQPGQVLDNASRIMVEMADLMAVYEMLGVPAVRRDLIESKVAKVEEFLTYSRSLGTLEEENEKA